VIAHLQLSDFFVAVERSAHPEFGPRPLLIGGPVNARGSVAVASPEARARGVHTGMRMSDALALVPDAVCLPGSIERYLEASAQVDECLRSRPGAIEWISIDEAWLAFGRDGGVRGARPRLESLRDELGSRFGMSAAIGVGSTKAVAAVASRLVSPSGMLIVLPGYEARLLAPLDISRLPGLSADNAARLRADGITTLGVLASLDEPALHALVGRGGSVLARHALGLDDRAMAADALPRGIVRAAAFGACGPAQARGAILRLADDAAAALRRSGHAARQVRIRVRDRAGERLRAQALHAPAATDQEKGEQVDGLARPLLHPRRDLLEAAVCLSSLVPIEPQLTLFGARTA
jgi:DNA polymerase-4